MCRDIYWTFIDKIAIRPSCENKWIEKYNFRLSNEHWEHIHCLSYKVTRETKLQSFQIKIIHRIFPCNRSLYLWSIKESDICNICDNQIQDNIEHYFFYCPHTVNFWQFFKRWWYRFSNVDITLHALDIIFGVLNYNDDNILSLLNYLILAAKWYIYCRKKEQSCLLFHQYLVTVKMHVEVEKYIMYKNGKANEFHKQWDILYNNL